MRYTVWPDIDHITEETWPTQGLYGTFVGKLDAALGTFGEESKPVATPKPVTASKVATVSPFASTVFSPRAER